MQIAHRVDLLGTESAFAVAKRAAIHAATGAVVYPFHLGDINIATPQNIVDAAFKAVKAGKTGYCPNAGIVPLREALAADTNTRRGTHYTMENVVVQPGGKPVIGKFLQVVLNPGDEALCPSPGYPIYESQIRYWGGTPIFYAYKPTKNGFGIDIEALERSISPRTKVLILNDLHNPTGASCTHEELKSLADVVRRHDLAVLLDEAYFEVRFEGKSHSLASEPGMEERCVILYTFSKKFAMTGWRIGAALGPKNIMEYFEKHNTNMESCPNHFVQYGALEALQGDPAGAQQILAELKKRRDLSVEILRQCAGVKCFCPQASLYAYPDVTELMQKKGFGNDYAAFAEDVLVKSGVSACTRLHFGAALPGEKHHYLRFAFSGVNLDIIEKGLCAFRDYAQN